MNRHSPEASTSAPFAVTAALTATVVCAAMLVLTTAAVLVHPPTHLPGVLAANGDQNQGVKTTLYLVAFLVILPLAVIAVPRLADAIASGPNGTALGVIATLLIGALAVLTVIARVSALFPWGDDARVALIAGLCWWVVAGAILWRAIQPRRWQRVAALERFLGPLAVLAGVGAFACLLCVTSLRSLSVLALALGAVVIVATLALRRIALPSLAGWKGAAVDLAVIVLLALAIPDLVIFKARTGLQTLYTLSAIQGQENYLLGPANQVLAGGAMLVDTVSQYGVGSIYSLVGWFHLAPIGYGTLGFLDGVLNALVFISGYCVLRLAGASRAIAGGAVAVGVCALLYSLVYSVGALAEHGPLRFGLPLTAILAVTAGSSLRRPKVARAATLLVIAIAAVWSIEALAYTIVTIAAMTAVVMSRIPKDARRRWLLTGIGQATLAALAAHVLLAALTVIATGHLPDWGQYFAYFGAFIFGGVAKVTYGFARWSPGLAVAALYLVSAAGVVLALRRAQRLVDRLPTTFVALAGATAYGIALFSYFDNRSSTYLLNYVAFPALLTVVLWLVIITSVTERGTFVRSYANVCALSICVLLVASAWHSIGDRFSRSALAKVARGPSATLSALHRLWHPPAFDGRTPDGERLLARYMPAQRRSIVLLTNAADLAVEILMRSRRGNALPIGDPIEDSIVPSVRLAKLRRAVADLHPGDRLLMDSQGLAFLATLAKHPSTDPLSTSDPEETGALQEWTLKQIFERFEVRPIARDSQGLIVAQLALWPSGTRR